MEKNKIYEAIYDVLLFISFLILIGLGLFCLKEIAILRYVALVIPCLILLISIKIFNNVKHEKEFKIITNAMFGISFFSAFFLFFGDHKERAILEGYLIKGKLIHVEYEKEKIDPDGGNYINIFYLEPDITNNQKNVELLDWVLVVLVVLVVIINFKSFLKIRKLMFRKKHPFWEGELPEKDGW
jgi:nitric oxide reductase large subunit